MKFENDKFIRDPSWREGSRFIVVYIDMQECQNKV